MWIYIREMLGRVFGVCRRLSLSSSVMHVLWLNGTAYIRVVNSINQSINYNLSRI